MECRVVVNSLSDYVDSRDLWTSENDLRQIEEHLAACPQCQSIKLELTEIRGAARELPLHTPPRALWTRIINELEDELPKAERPTRIELRRGSWLEQLKAIRFTFSFPQLAGGVIAAALVLFVVFTRANQTPSGLEPINVTGVQTALLEDEEKIRTELERRLSVINERKANWDPEVRAEFEKNLGKIEESLNDSRRKLQANPADRIQQQMVLTLYNEKRQLLEDMERLKW
ncbi:MAG TPA: zf-HC2 domain-containing protein [Blastocatellia bacterium]|nr:zf-HC2 domain-containing protein [Blastocatellia bacterium]